MKKFYAIKKGNIQGIVTSYEEYQQAIKGYPNFEAKGFSNHEKAKEWLETEKPWYAIYHDGVGEVFQNKSDYKKRYKEIPNCKSRTQLASQKIAEDWIKAQQNPKKEVEIYVDGSFTNDICGYGIVIKEKNSTLSIYGAERSDFYSQYQSQGAELKAIERAMHYLCKQSYTNAKIRTDFHSYNEFLKNNEKAGVFIEALQKIIQGKCSVAIKFISDNKNQNYKEADQLSKKAVKFLQENNFISFEA